MPLSLTLGIVTACYKTISVWVVVSVLLLLTSVLLKQCLWLQAFLYAFHYVTDLSAVFVLNITFRLVRTITGPSREFWVWTLVYAYSISLYFWQFLDMKIKCELFADTFPTKLWCFSGGWPVLSCLWLSVS